MAGAFNHFKQIADALPGALGEIVSETSVDCVKNIQGFIRHNGQISNITTKGHVHMIDTVHVEDGPNAQTKFVICGAPYGIFQNYGTRFMPGRPFWEPGIEQTRPGFEARLGALESRLPH